MYSHAVPNAAAAWGASARVETLLPRGSPSASPDDRPDARNFLNTCRNPRTLRAERRSRRFLMYVSLNGSLTDPDCSWAFKICFSGSELRSTST